MIHTAGKSRHANLRPIPRRARKPSRPAIERLEQRCMMANDLPQSIVIGRTLSAWSVADVQDRQVSLTYTVYNEEADPATGVLLTTALQPGVTFAGASQPPDRDGQELAWSLGTIPAFSRASVTLTVTLPESTSLQLDAGAEAFATVNAGLVSDDTPAAMLRPDPIPAELLVSTPDANTSDPFIQEKAAELDYDPGAIFDFLRDDIGYNAYAGSLRGARGTLWSAAGNSVDVASLGVALMRASGIPAQYQQGSLPTNLTQQLILSMFPPSYQTLGSIPAGTQTANPLNDFTLYADSSSFHTWFQFDTGDGQGLRDADPLIPGASIGQSFTAAQETFAEVPDDQRHKTEVELTAEIWSQAAATFGIGAGLSTITVLDQTFDTVELVGRPLSIGHFVSTNSIGTPVFSSTTNVYSPYIILGDLSVPGAPDPEIIRGQDFQEILTNFPLGTQVLTGLFLNLSLTGPGMPLESHERALVDRIGYAARQGTATTPVSVDPNGPPALTGFEFFTVDVLPGRQLRDTPARLAPSVADSLGQFGPNFENLFAEQSATALSRLLTGLSQLEIARVLELSDEVGDNASEAAGVTAYFDRPRITISRIDPTLEVGIDLLRDRMRAVLPPGQNPIAALIFSSLRGLQANAAETVGPLTGADGDGVSTAIIFALAEQQRIPVVTLTAEDGLRLGTLDVSAEARARIVTALNLGKMVFVPARSPVKDGIPVIGWYELDPETGDTSGLLEDGTHGFGEYFAGLQTRITAAVRILVGSPAQQVKAVETAKRVQVLVDRLEKELAYRAAQKAADKKLLKEIVKASVAVILNTLAAAQQDLPPGLKLYLQVIAANVSVVIQFLNLDPTAPTWLSGLATPIPRDDAGFGSVAVSRTITPGQLTGSRTTDGALVSGEIVASWASTVTNGFAATRLGATGAVVRDANGAVVGTGVVDLNAVTAQSLEVSGQVNYVVQGRGALAFYAQAGPGLGVGGEWDDYSATATGDVSVVLTTAALTLNGQALPAGKYTVSSPSVTLSGNGRSSSPNFSGSASIAATGGTILLQPGAGAVTSAGGPLDPAAGATVIGYTGTVSVTANPNDTVTAALSGTAADILQVSANSGSLTTDQNTPVTFSASVRTSLADTYTLAAQAPPGWTVTIDSGGSVTVTPAPGLQGGTFPIRLIARSTVTPDLTAQAIVNVTITPTQPGISLQVDHDPMFTVPYNGAEIPSAFHAIIHNDGPTSDTFNLSFSNVQAGFTVVGSRTSVTIPAGQTGVVGVYLIPNVGQPLPAPGTQVSFTVTATSTSDATITQSETETFTVPEIHGVSITSSPTTVSTTPGVPTTAAITIRAVGNVAETITLSATTTAGLSLAGLSTLTLQAGEATTQTLTLTPGADTPLNSTLLATITADFGPSNSPLKPTLPLLVRVVVPGAEAIARASVAAEQLSNPALADRFDDLAVALTNLFQDPANPVFKGQVLANLDSLVSQLANDPFLSGFTGGLTAARDAVSDAATAAEVQSAVSDLGQALDDLAAVIVDVADHGFTLGLTPDRQIVQPNAPLVFAIPLTNNGNVATTYVLSVSGLPAGVTASFSQTTVTLQPGQSLFAGSTAPTLTLRETGDTLVALSFTVTVTAQGAPEISRSVTGQLTLRDESAVVTGVVTDPPFTDAGGTVGVSAKILGTVNQPTQITASFTVADPDGNIVFTSTPTPVDLAVSSGLITVDLGDLDTSGFVNGVHAIVVTLSTGASAATTLFIGQPVSGTLTTTPTVVPTGAETVTSTIHVTTHGTFPEPLSLLGAAATDAPGTSVAIYEVGGQLYAYESGTGGIVAFEVTDPTDPQLLKVFGQGDVVNGQFGFNIARVVNDVLVVATTTALNANGFTLLVYSLADPSDPQLVSSTVINHRFLSDLLVNSTNTAAFVPTNGVFFFGNSVSSNFGDFSAIDLSDPTQPVLASTLFNNRGPLDGGDMNQFGGTLVNDQIAYSAGLAPGGNTVIGNHGNLLIVDISNVDDIELIGQLAIPGTINILDVAVEGNRALVVGSAGKETGIIDFNARGLINNLTLTVLDITDPRNPVILGSTLVTNHQFPLNEQGGKVDVVGLGNGAFAVSGTAANGQPALAVVDATDPDNIVVGATQVPSFVHGITVSGDKLYATTASGLSIYQIQELVSSPVSITVDLPAGTAANIIPGSFNIAPSQILTSASGDTLVWNRAFAAGNTEYTFTWQTKVSGVDEGESVPVTSGAAISFVDQGTPGSVSLPGTAVTGVGLITITPTTQTVQPGGSVTYNVRLVNPTGSAVTYSLSAIQSTFRGFYDLPFSVNVPANGAVDVPLVFTAYNNNQPGDDTITVTATYRRFTPDFQTLLGEYTDSASTGVTIAGAPVVQPDETARGVVAQLTPVEATVGRQGRTRYVVRLTNTGSEADFFGLQVTGLPDGAFASFDDSFLEIPPGASNFREVVLTVETSGAEPGRYPFTVVATSSSRSSVLGTVEGALNVVVNGVSVFLSPSSGEPGGGFSLTVSNTGTVEDTFDLALGGPAALVASLATARVTLAPGGSRVIPIATDAVNFALPGALNLMATATSVAQPSVRDAATADLTISTFQGLGARFEPAEKTLTTPGTTTFQLLVDNTGNAEDLYTATIVGSTGGLSASLLGLDGQSTRTIPLFRLPALATGALGVRANMGSAGRGTVTVRITSLSDPSRTMTVTATLVAQALIATTTQLTVTPTSPMAGQPVTLSATVSGAGGAVPTGRVRFTVDGVALDPVALTAAGGVARATLTLPSLAAGSHSVTAAYLPDDGFQASAAAPVAVAVGNPDQTPPTVAAVERLGIHMQPTQLVLRFSEPLDRAGAENLANYRLVMAGRDGRLGTRDDRAIRFRRATYDDASRSVTLLPASRLSVRQAYLLAVQGVDASGITDLAGNPLDGDGDGLAGGRFATRIDRSKLVLGAKVPTMSAHRRAGVPKRLAIAGNPRIARLPRHRGA